MMTTNPAIYQSAAPCKCGAKGIARKMGGNICLKCNTLRGQGNMPEAAEAAPETESLEDFIKAGKATKLAFGASGADDGYLARERACERERELFAAYRANGNSRQFLLDNY